MPERFTDEEDAVPAGSRHLRLDDQFCLALYAATNAVTRAYRPLLGALRLTDPQHLVTLALWQDGAMAVRRLAERPQLGSNAITPLADQLEAAGLAARSRGGGGGGVVLVALTEAGRRLEDAAARAGTGRVPHRPV